MRTPSPQLTDLLKRLNLCTPADLRACQPRVRRLVRDLPAFDSVWIDALVQLRRLTPYQAQVLLSEDPERLNAGPCVLVDKLGHHDSGHTFLARRRESEEQCVVKFVDPDAGQFEIVAANLGRLATAFRQFSHQAIAGPHASLEHEGRLVAVSRNVPGASIRDTLVQTGRFQPHDVIEIGRQILSGLAAMERHWDAHGDIRIANLRLTVDGSACLVNCGIALASERRFIVHRQLRPDRCDTVAPELIGTDRPPDAQSDLYAVGCLMWQLLCGRPPFPCADPLEKLAAHQTQDVPDVRDIAPHTPDWVAAAIQTMTARDRTQRPPSFSDASRRWNQHTATRLPGPTALNRFSPRIREMARRSTPKKAASNWLLAATLLICISGAGLVLATGNTGSLFLPSATATESGPTQTASAGMVSTGEPKVLPAPDAQGVITLPDRGPWRGSRIESPGQVVIHCPSGSPALIELTEPMVAIVDGLTLSNVSLVGDNLPCLVDCTSRTVRLSRTTLAGTGTVIGLKWTTADKRDRSGRNITVTDSIFRGVRAGLDLRDMATDINFGNVLLTDGRSAVRMSVPGRTGQNTTFRLFSVTMRRMAHIVESVLPEAGATPAHMSVVMDDSVFALTGRNAATFALIGPELPQTASPIIETSTTPDADASLMATASRVAIWVNPVSGTLGEVSEGLVNGEGLIPSPLRFRSDSAEPSASALLEFDAPRSSMKTPGVTPETLPKP